MIEDDVFEIALPNDMGGTCVFVKKRTENIDVKGRWESELLPFPIEFTENAYTIYKSNGDAVENGSGSYTMDGNSFIADGFMVLQDFLLSLEILMFMHVGKMQFTLK